MRGASPRQDENPLVHGSGQRRASDPLGPGSSPERAQGPPPLDSERNVRVVYAWTWRWEVPMLIEFREILVWLRTSGVRVLLKALPSKQWDVARELRRRIKSRFEREKIAIPYPHRVVITRTE